MNDKVKVMIKNVAILCLIALISGLLLGGINILTYVDPMQATLDGFKKDSGASGEFALIVGNDGEKVDCSNGEIIYYAKSTDNVYAFLASGTGGYGGSVQMYVYIKENKIYLIKQGENSETFFATVEKAEFYKKFYDKDLTTLDVFDYKAGDMATGATKTSTAVQNAVNSVVEYFNNNNLGGNA